MKNFILIQMHKPARTLSSALLDDIASLIFPLRVIVREIGLSKSVVYFPGSDINDDAETTQAQRCMNVVYREANLVNQLQELSPNFIVAEYL